jgi:hypothetical protein
MLSNTARVIEPSSPPDVVQDAFAPGTIEIKESVDVKFELN